MERYERQFMESGCPVDVYEEAKVTVPCAVRAFTEVGDVVIKCTGTPVVIRNSCETPGDPCAVSKFTVSQRIRVDIPLAFKAEAKVGRGHVDFDIEPTPEHCCRHMPGPVCEPEPRCEPAPNCECECERCMGEHDGYIYVPRTRCFW